MAQSVSARPWCIRSRVRSPDLTSLFRLLSFQCSLSSFKYPLKRSINGKRGGGGGGKMSAPSASFLESKGTSDVT